MILKIIFESSIIKKFSIITTLIHFLIFINFLKSAVLYKDTKLVNKKEGILFEINCYKGV